MTKPGWLRKTLEEASKEVKNRPQYLQQLRMNQNEYGVINNDPQSDSEVNQEKNKNDK